MAADLRACSDTAFLSGSGVEVAHAPLLRRAGAAATRQPGRRAPCGGRAVALRWLCRVLVMASPLPGAPPRMPEPTCCRQRCGGGHAAAGHAAARVLRVVMAAMTMAAMESALLALRLSGRVTGYWRGRLTLTRRPGRQERMISSPSNVMIGALPRYLPLPLPSGSLPGHLRNPLISARASGSDTVCPPSVQANCHQ